METLNHFMQNTYKPNRLQYEAAATLIVLTLVAITLIFALPSHKAGYAGFKTDNVRGVTFTYR